MIDPEKKEKILKLKKEGYTNSKIKEKIGVSLPTIRKILKESTQASPSIKDEEKSHTQDSQSQNTINQLDFAENIQDSPEEDEILIINLSRNYPFGTNTPRQILRNGAPTWLVHELLGKLYPPDTVKSIIHGFNRIGPKQKVYQVKISSTHNKVSITPLTT
jgi:hypothetical protein